MYNTNGKKFDISGSEVFGHSTKIELNLPNELVEQVEEFASTQPEKFQKHIGAVYALLLTRGLAASKADEHDKEKD